MRDPRLIYSLQVDQQLKDGVRMLQSQAHLKDGVIHLCHTSCVRFARVISLSCGGR